MKNAWDKRRGFSLMLMRTAAHQLVDEYVWNSGCAAKRGACACVPRAEKKALALTEALRGKGSATRMWPGPGLFHAGRFSLDERRAIRAEIRNYVRRMRSDFSCSR